LFIENFSCVKITKEHKAYVFEKGWLKPKRVCRNYPVGKYGFMMIIARINGKLYG
jgi:hypothetical protein